MKRSVFLRTAYNYDMNEAGDESGLSCPEQTLTQQQFEEECDINTIVRRFNITGELPTGVHMPTYQDFDGIFDFRTAMEAIRTANESFDEMPAEVRARFHNDPAEFVDFCNDEANRAEAQKMGLVMAQAAELAKTTPQPPSGGETEPPKG